uniref:Reverse transcriptase domain-containing protein n=1 Tax=Tanacetum cinerariifolium TaxID=118510 RepID=A0A6L2KW94_TANCI|nr:reverse transcriptase domain-containing protein [Tanacetum cinerariifolium]
MRTRYSCFPNNSSVTIPRCRNKRFTPNVVKPELRTIVEVAPMADNRTMKELLQAPRKANPYHGFERENPHTHINNFRRITSTLKFKNVPNDVIKLMIFSYSLEGSARVWENASKTDDRIDKLADQISTLVDIFAKKVVNPAPVKAVEESCVTCGGPHAHYNCDAINSNQASICVETGTYNQVAPQNRARNYMAPPGFALNQALTLGTLPSNTISNPKGKMKAITTRSGVAYEGPLIHTNPSPKKAVEQKTKETTDKEQTNFQGTMLVKNLPEKLGDPNKFLIPCDFPEMNVCHSLADLGASINLMPLSIWKKLSLPELTPTRMTLELADRSITHPKGVVEDIFVKVGKFHFPIDFVVVDFEADPRTTRYSSIYDDLSVNRIDIIDIAREEYAQEILVFSNNSSGGSPTSTSEPILFDSSLSLTLFEGSDFILEEIEAYLKDESISPKIDHADSKAKYLIEEPSELELKDLPSHLEYAYLEGVDKLPVIIAKDLKVDKKEALLKVLKSHKRAIAWKITDIKGIDPQFCTHKILMEEGYKPAVQSQRQVNLKIHEVIKKEVIKLLDARMILTVRSIVYMDHSALKYLLSKQDAKPRLIRWVLFLQEFDIIISDKKETKNLVVDHLSRLENPHKDVFENKDIKENFPLETLGTISSGSTHGIDFMGPFSSSRGNRYILLAVDYFSKWVEAKALPTNDARVVVKFLKSLFARFGTPRAIISDHGTHFCNDKFDKVMSKYGVTHRLATAYHPQTSGQVEVLNQGLKRILERTVGENRASWSEKLKDACGLSKLLIRHPLGALLIS